LIAGLKINFILQTPGLNLLPHMNTAPLTMADTTALETCIQFLEEIGIPVTCRSLGDTCFLPGLAIEGSGLVMDPERLAYPGDILHEAGHIAVVPAAERAGLNENSIAARPHREAEEMMAIAWSYAACVHLGLEAGFVFHEHGYRSGGAHLAESFSNGHYFGVPMLQWVGMCLERPDPADPGQPVYPKMQRWMRA
jgi:hypothetical protein